ncbi:MAG TPA: histidine kinase [Candidatus Acidoferrales bacterium]
MPERRWFTLTPRNARGNVVRWSLILLGWTLLALFFFTQTYLTYLYTNRPGQEIPTGFLLKLSLSEWYVWAALTPVMVWLARRFPLERGRWLRGLMVHIPASVAVALVKFTVDVIVRSELLGMTVAPNVMSRLHPNMVTYWIVVGLAMAFLYYQRYRERELRASQLEARLAESRLQVLKMQLHPHFLFNTLHAISTLMHRDVEAADRMLARLSDLLRLTLDRTGVQEVPLAEELDFLQRYLEIEQARFEDRLQIGLDVAPGALDAHVPYLFLQPIVENAIRHGVAPRAAGGRVEITAFTQSRPPAGEGRREDSRLVVEVRDDGPGLPSAPGAALREGLGLANTRARLQQLYGAEQEFELANGATGGLTVRITLPFHTSPAAFTHNRPPAGEGRQEPAP